FLLGVGSGVLSEVPCNLNVQPLDVDPDKALAMALEVAYVAAGTRTLLGNAGLPSDTTFQQFRDATMQVAEELAAEGTLPSDTPTKVALAWAAVGLPPRGGAPTIAAPANNTTDVVYPWTTLVWPTAGEVRQTGAGWAFPIVDGSLPGPTASAEPGSSN